MKLAKNLGKCVIALVAVALIFGTVPAKAANLELFQKGVEMMIKSNDMLREAVKTVEGGQAMYVQICTDKGCLPEVTKGNQVITDAMQEAKKGMALLDQGQQEYKVCVADRRLEGMYRCLDTFVEGGRMVQDSLRKMESGVKANNDALRAKNLDAFVEAPTKTILKGTESGLTAMKLFLDGQKIALENRPKK